MKTQKQNQGRRPMKRQNKSTNPITNNRPDTRVWNVNAEEEPFMRNLTVKDNREYNVVQTSNIGNILNSVTGSPAGATKNWTSADINQFASFAAVFDQYKIKSVEVWIVPYGSASVPGYNPGASGVRWYSVTDYDDSNNLTTAAGAMQYQNCMATTCQSGHYRHIKPHLAVAAYGGAFTQFKNEPAGWIDSASTSVQHYGLKILVEPTGSNNDVRFQAWQRLHVAFRNVF